MKLSKRKFLICGIIGLLSLLIIISIGTGIFLFDYAIVRKPPLSNEVSPNATLISGVMAQSRIDGKLWLKENNSERLTVISGDGIELVGYFVKAIEPSSKKLAVLIHGHRSNATMMGNYGKYFREQGYHVFMADNRGHGESGGKYVGMGWIDRLDYLEWIDLLINRLGNDVQIVIHGISMGASTALTISGEGTVPNQVVAVIADCGFSSVAGVFKHQLNTFFHLPAFPILHIGSLISDIFAGYNFFEASAIKQVKKTDIPIFIIHGDADNYNPTFMAYDIYDSISGEKELWIVPKADHGMAYYENPSC
jgi:fermentation-respiration switch protein FrsA (DUF1100 family)